MAWNGYKGQKKGPTKKPRKLSLRGLLCLCPARRGQVNLVRNLLRRDGEAGPALAVPMLDQKGRVTFGENPPGSHSAGESQDAAPETRAATRVKPGAGLLAKLALLPSRFDERGGVIMGAAGNVAGTDQHQVDAPVVPGRTQVFGKISYQGCTKETACRPGSFVPTAHPQPHSSCLPPWSCKAHGFSPDAGVISAPTRFMAPAWTLK